MHARALLILAMIAATTASADAERVQWGPLGFAFVPDGAVVDFESPVKVLRVELAATREDGTRVPVLTEMLPGRAIARHRLFFTPRDRVYTLTVFRRDGEAPLVITHRPAESDLAEIGMVLQVPYAGQQDITRRWGKAEAARVPFFAEVTAEIELMTWSRPVAGELRVTLGAALAVTGEPSGWRRSRAVDGGTVLARDVTLETPMRVEQFLLPVRVVGAAGARASVRARFAPAPASGLAPIERATDERIVSAEELSKRIRVVELRLPAGPRGERDLRRPRDTLVLDSRLGRSFRKALGVAETYRDYNAPFTYQAVVLENTGDARLPVAVSMRVCRMDDDAPVAAFQPGDGAAGTAVAATVWLDPGRKTPVVLPVFVRADDVLTGRYRTVVDVRVYGTDRVVASVDRPFEVRTMDLRAFVVTAAAILISVGGLVVFLVRQRRIFRSFRVSELVLIALFATMTFVLVIFPGSILGPLFSALAGPFAFLIQGLFFEALRVLVLVTLLMLVPRPGTVTLVSIVRYLIGGLVFGGFTPVDLFYLGTSVALTESALWAAGVTTRRGLLRRREVTWRALAVVTLVMAATNGAVQFVTVCLNISFYRLYFAEWFIWLSVMINGVLYAALGAVPGVRLGLRLKRVSE